MLPRLILSQAWVEREGLSDADLALFASSEPSNAVAAVDGDACPKCHYKPVDHESQLIVWDTTTATPERVDGRVYIRCVACRTIYYCAVVADVEACQPLGLSNVRLAATSKPVVPPVSSGAPVHDEPSPSRQHRMLDAHDIVMASYQRRNWHPAFDQPNVSRLVVPTTFLLDLVPNNGRRNDQSIDS